MDEKPRQVGTEPVSDLNVLAQKIAALAAVDEVFEAGARVVSRAGQPAPVAAILREIDDTILERNLEFAAGENTVNLIISGRRLRGVLSASPTPKDASSVIGHMLSRDEPDVLSATCELLHTLFDLQTEVTVKSLPPEPFGKGGDRGISARSLAEIWQIDLDETPQPPMVRFLAANVGAISAMLHVSDGETVANSGDSDALETIWDTQVLAFQKSQKAYRTADDGPQLICLEGALADDTAAAFALAGDDVALIAYQPDHLAAMLASWHAITG